MPKIVLFHPVLGLSDSVRSFADRLVQLVDPEKNFTITTPDLFDGQTFTDEAAAQAYVQAQGFPYFLEKARGFLPQGEDFIIAGFSFGGAVAQTLAVQVPRVKACMLFHSALSPEELGITAWPAVHLQIHFAFSDPWKKTASISALETLVDASQGLFQYWAYPIKGHIFSLEGFPSYHAEHAEKLLDNTADFLDRYGC